MVYYLIVVKERVVMKKSIKGLLIVLCLNLLLLIGCTNNVFNKYIKEIKVPQEVSEDFYLPAIINKNGDHDIYWTSSNTDYINVKTSSLVELEGLLYYPVTVKQCSNDTIVTLTMLMEINNKGSITKEYEVKVMKINLENKETIDFTFYSVNDFHGSVINDNGGLSVMGNYLINESNKSPEQTIILSSGDMFQGSAISNMTQGAVVVEAMNKIGFVSMTIGNHEFDWGIDLIRNYNNKTSEVKTNFPIICCNIFEKATDKPVDWCEPYTIVEKAGIKIGIIGAIGSELESSIATNRVELYEFKDPVEYIKKYTKELRTEKDCEIVVLSIHDNTSNMNQIYANLTGEYQLDAMFNGHTHSTYAGETMGSDGLIMPYIQSGSYGSAIGKIVISYNKITKKIENGSAENITVTKSLSKTNEEIDKIVNKYNEQISSISGKVIGIAGQHIDQTTGARWAVNVIRDYSNCQIGFINNGGIRNAAFPIAKDQEVTVGKIWEIMPFDNFVKTCEMTTSQVIQAYFSTDVLHSDNIEVRNGKLYFNGIECKEDEVFTVAAVDFIFDKENFPFLKGNNQSTTGQLFRDYLIQAIKDECKDGEKWNG